MSGELRVVLTEYPENSYMNMSYEEAFFLSRCNDWSNDILRIWRNENAVVIGIFQRADEEVDLDFAREKNIQVVRRFTGGGAVYHDLGNINFALSTKIPSSMPRGVDFLYENLINGALEALRRLGFSPAKENINDIVIEGKKVIGVAGSLRGDCAFLHGAMLFSTNLSTLSRVLKVPLKKLQDKKIESVKYRVSTISHLKPELRSKDVISALIDGFSETLDSRGYYFDMPFEKEIELARKLYAEKYSTSAWNMERRRP
ncbi:MAG: biotin/lipoate A/B protein ligase family protein [Fervidicoccaceae archaeon]